MSKLHVFDELSKTEQLAVAVKVANFCKSTADINGIVPVSINEVMETELAYVAMVEEQFAGYIRLKQEIVHERTLQIYRPIGTLVVAEFFQGNGIGTELVSKISTDVLAAQNIPFAFCNPLSLKSFKSAGFIEALTGELPSTAVSIHNNQPSDKSRQYLYGADMSKITL